MYPWRIRDQGLPWLRDLFNQGFDSSTRFHGPAILTNLQPLAIASGLSVGKEGPSVHVACSFGNTVARLFSRYDRSHRTFAYGLDRLL